MELNTPALLFSVVSLFFIAFTTRFLGLAAVSRQLFQRLIQEKASGANYAHTEKQLVSLRKRLEVIQGAQCAGLFTLSVASMSMAALYLNCQWLGEALFFVSLIVLIISVLLSVAEITMSLKTLDIEYEHHKIGD